MRIVAHRRGSGALRGLVIVMVLLAVEAGSWLSAPRRLQHDYLRTWSLTIPLALLVTIPLLWLARASVSAAVARALFVNPSAAGYECRSGRRQVARDAVAQMVHAQIKPLSLAPATPHLFFLDSSGAPLISPIVAGFEPDEIRRFAGACAVPLSEWPDPVLARDCEARLPGGLPWSTVHRGALVLGVMLPMLVLFGFLGWAIASGT